MNHGIERNVQIGYHFGQQIAYIYIDCFRLHLFYNYVFFLRIP